MGYCSCMKAIADNYADAKIKLFGVFNLPEATWSDNLLGLRVASPVDSSELTVGQWYAFLHVHKYIFVPNEANVFLDVLFSNGDSLVVSRVQDMLNDNYHHISYKYSINLHALTDEQLVTLENS